MVVAIGTHRKLGHIAAADSVLASSIHLTLAFDPCCSAPSLGVQTMPTSKCDFKMTTDNELFNGMRLVPDDEDGLNEMVDELARRAGYLSVSDYLQKSVRQGTFNMCRRP
jgi:hypothetical protein